jgi:hypothetical protein
MAHARWTREDVVEVIREWAAGGGDMRINSYWEWKRGREALADVTIARLFGSWRELVRAAGLRAGRPSRLRRRVSPSLTAGVGRR